VIYGVSNTFRAVGWILAVLAIGGWALYIFINIRQARRETGAEVELAANRAPPPDDEVFEGRRLELVQAFGAVFLLVIVLALPIYWLLEPGRQAGASRGVEDTSVGRGEHHFESCAGCHGANLRGGVATQVVEVPSPDGGEAVKVRVNWRAPALNVVFKRFDSEITTPLDSTEVRQIITYGRAPVMPAWGVDGGGPLNQQEIQSLLDYIWSEQISDEQAQADAAQEFADATAAPENADKSAGEVLFELNCARCHTPNWPFRGPQPQDNGTIVIVPPGPQGAGRYGPTLNRTTLLRLFPDPADQVEFVTSGAEANVPYGDPASGIARQGSFGMPSFGRILSQENISAIVEYERSLVQDTDDTYGVVEREDVPAGETGEGDEVEEEE
jgi:mono/diheme cytochrome c family protein